MIKKDDIFTWSFTDEYLKAHKHEPYWCKSRIAVFNGTYLLDTFWQSTDSSILNECDVELNFVANFDDLVEAKPSDRTYYLDSDCVDLGHSNNSSEGNFYLRKGAVKNVDKMERILKRSKSHIEKSIEYQLRTIERLENELLSVSIDSYVNPSDGVSLEDESWQDQ